MCAVCCVGWVGRSCVDDGVHLMSCAISVSGLAAEQAPEATTTTRHPAGEHPWTFCRDASTSRSQAYEYRYSNSFPAPHALPCSCAFGPARTRYPRPQRCSRLRPEEQTETSKPRSRLFLFDRRLVRNKHNFHDSRNRTRVLSVPCESRL